MQKVWHSRHYLPHFEAGEVPQFVTFRLADALPREVLERWQLELQRIQKSAQFLRLSAPAAAMRVHEMMTVLNRRIEAYLDRGHGACILCDARLATIVEEALLFFDGQRYSLHAWVVMPNHVHVLFTPSSGWSLSQLLGSWKSFTSKEMGKVLVRKGTIWQHEYFDRAIRSDKHYLWTIDYIERNPVKAGLCNMAEDWRFSSARQRIVSVQEACGS